jgi:hypothetical protein
MDRTADLDAALSFVISRIAEQAKLSGEPLSEQQRLLLSYLPSPTPAVWYPGIPEMVPRNIDLERVCELGNAAYTHDRHVNPASLDWEFAFAVFALNRHPMRGLLQWTGMTAQAEVGRRSTYCHWFGAHSGRGPACLERRWTLVPVDSNRFGMRC